MHSTLMIWKCLKKLLISVFEYVLKVVPQCQPPSTVMSHECLKQLLLLLMSGRNPANSPVEVKVVKIPLFAGVLYTNPGGCAGFLNHQQYYYLSAS